MDKLKRFVNWRIWAVSLIMLMTLLLVGKPSAAFASELPLTLDAEEIQQVDFYRSDTDYVPLFPDRAEDRQKIERLVELYNKSTSNLGMEDSLFKVVPQEMFYFFNKVRFSLAGGDFLTMVPYQIVKDEQNWGVGFYMDTPKKSRMVVDPKLSRELQEVALRYFTHAKGIEVNGRQIHMGEQLTVRSDMARGDTATILLMPSYWPVTMPSAPAPFPVPEAILIDSVPVEHDRFSYTFKLAEQMGQMLDGAPGKIAPGAWDLVVESGAETRMLPITILPSVQPEPKAVVYDRGRVLTWSKTTGLTVEMLANPKDSPMLVGEKEEGNLDTHISFDFLRMWLGVPIAKREEGSYQLGGPELGLVVTEGEGEASLNGTMISLRGTLHRENAIWLLPWHYWGIFLDYRTQWLGPDTVAFLRGLDHLPIELSAVLNDTRPASLGKNVYVTLLGKRLDLGTQQAYRDSKRDMVMVPLRATVEALGGKLAWFPLEPGYAQIAARNNYGLPPIGAEVNAYTDVELGSKKWRLYLTPAHDGKVMVPLDKLALALGYRLSWDIAQNRVNLIGEDLRSIQAVEVVTIEINGKKLASDVEPVMLQNRVLISLRSVAEALDATVLWDSASKTATITDATAEVKINVDSKTAYRNGQELSLYVPATEIDDRIMVPLRFVSETLGAKVEWRADQWLVLIER